MTEKPAGAHGCTGISKRTGQPCDAHAIKGTKRCPAHSGTSLAKAKAKGAIVVELRQWGLTDTTQDPGEVLLRLVTQSAHRVEFLSDLLRQAYEAGEELKAALEAEQLLIEPEPEDDFDEDGNPIPAYERAGVKAARIHLQRIFTTGGVAALIGSTLSDTKTGDIYATGEAIRGLAKLEADERQMCANFAAKAVAAGLAERQVRLAEQQGALIAQLLRAVLGDPDLALTADQLAAASQVVPRHLRAIEGGKTP